MTIECVRREVASYHARPHTCFPIPTDLDAEQCFGYIPQSECGVVISDSSSDELRIAAALTGFPDVLSEEDAFRFLIAKAIADREIAAATGIIGSVLHLVYLIFGIDDSEKAILDGALFSVRNNYEYPYMIDERKSLDLNALRNRARQFVEQAQATAEKPVERPSEMKGCNGTPFGTSMICDMINFGGTVYDLDSHGHLLPDAHGHRKGEFGYLQP